MQALISILIICTTIFTSGGWLAVAVGLRTQYKILARYEMQTSKDYRFVLHHTDSDPVLVWEHAREFTFDGWMYDVKTMVDSAGATVIIAHKDFRESEIVMAISHVLKPRSPFSKPLARIIQNALMLIAVMMGVPELPTLIEASLYVGKTLPSFHSEMYVHTAEPPPKYLLYLPDLCRRYFN